MMVDADDQGEHAPQALVVLRFAFLLQALIFWGL